MHQKSYIEHDDNGRIIAAMQLRSDAYEANRTNPNLIEGVASPATHYVKEGMVLDRPIQETFLDGNTLRNLPIPCQIQINDDIYECDDDNAELGFDFPMTYRVTVRAWPYLDAEFTYENQP